MKHFARAFLFGVVIVGALQMRIAPMETHAASFDCGAVTTLRERLICADPELSYADEELAAAFKATLAELSEVGQAELRKSQRGWIDYTDIICATDRDDDRATVKRGQTACLTREVGSRAKRLESSIAESGGLVIRRVDVFKAVRSPEPRTSGVPIGVTTTAIAYPQIDRPRDAGEERWNEMIAERSGAARYLAKDHENEDYSVNYRLGIVSPAMISVSFVTYGYRHGAPYGTSAGDRVAWLLHEGRPLRADDVFRHEEPWQPALARLVFERGKSGAGADSPIKGPAMIEAAVADPQHWLITERGLRVNITPTDLRLNGFGGIGAEIPWEALKPYLVSMLPFPIAAN